MPWWSWILLWLALIAVSLLCYVLLGVRLFRKFMATVRELSAAGERLGHRTHLPERPDDDGESPVKVFGAAVFASPEQMRHDYVTAKASRQEVRRQKRVKRKAERGQPQSLHDIDFS
ncbi:hypothetical protein AHiyo8_63980 [Arthrobacter sp. Hiyo8]|jgi:hypothetical protein|uniref:hypothetical protein n=1 Tax=Arthrobacter TaxID=1663 RepID=UPI0006838065|nr:MULTISPECIES: hypothetical protein [Arthrobacter]MDQ0240651.1 hypothetical protein [Arthrobacter bambusae]BAS18095.1 hypothetical protein AHiyo8_63980 [Arthrobacter sp. Hiyo8]GAP60081.1 hypothetical protein AHiyo1_35270 [Arthrobacter sp. Hiyo1]